MRKAAYVIFTTTLIPLLVLGACAKEEEQQPAQYPAQQQPYPQQQYPQQTAPAPTTAPAPQPTVAPAGTGTTGAMSVPGAMATPCQNDAPCLTHRCNTQYGKCAFPCTPGNANDCMPGNTCMAGACVPGGVPGSTPTQ